MSESHWETIYRTRNPTLVSWYQFEPRLSLDLVQRVASDPDAPIIDVGAGASMLVDRLLDAGYRDLTALDLAPSALAIAQIRLGARASRVTWVAASVLDVALRPAAYAVWHDRALFHFLTDPDERARYVAQVRRALRPGGHVVVASFGPSGPTRCSGLDVVRYSPEAMHAGFGAGFRLVESVAEEHRTPSGSTQAFTYCVLRLEGGRPPVHPVDSSGPSA